MVVRTPPLSSLKTGFLPQIHHPLPLNRRESQHLLESITTSFRKNLDREHPWNAGEPSINTPASSRSVPAEQLRTSNHRPTDRHLRAILSNPLFAHNADTPLPTTTSKPFDVFDSAVAKGLMTTRRAAGFLATVRSQLTAESPDNLRQRMGASGAALLVVRWLRSSGQENDLDFLGNPALLGLLVPFMYAENMQEVAWTWLAQLAARATKLEYKETPGKANAQALSRLMSAIIKENSVSNTQTQISLDGSFAALAKANAMLPRRDLAAIAAVRNNWAQLSWISTVDALGRPRPSVPLFEDFVELGRPLNLPLDLAHLDLHHPTMPTHSTAIEYLRLRQKIAEDVPNMKPRAQQRILCLVLDAAERLKRTGQLTEAPWLERLRNTIYERLNLGILNTQIGASLDSNLPIQRGL
ncbi:hypothetical protein F4808DRAFT_114691 [Astrocystis sublimbata]|nr:hypothetical protein F4808DRAFT_114691 [Astrocystis sublimbata]